MGIPDLVVENERLRAHVAELEQRIFQLQTLYDIGWELERRPDLLLDPAAADSMRVILATIMGAFGAMRGVALQTGLNVDGECVVVRKGFDEDSSHTSPSTCENADLGTNYRRWRACAPATPRSWLTTEMRERSDFLDWLQAMGILVWVPFTVDEDAIGGVGLGTRLSAEPYSQGDVALLESIADNAMVRLRHARLLARSLAHQREQSRIRGLFERFMPPQVVNMLLEGQLKLDSGGERQIATILMADLRNSTPLIQQLRSEAMVRILNDYFAAMTDIVFRYEGTVDKFMGDSVLAVFGAPISHHDDPKMDDVMRAVQVSLEMQSAFTRLESAWQLKPAIDVPIGLGVGICTGEVVVGNVGSAKRVEYTAIGPPVNLAARLSKLARGGETYIDERTYLAASPALKARRLRPIQVKGFREPVRIFRVSEILFDGFEDDTRQRAIACDSGGTP